jgi:signal transduction histidine kinase
MKEAPALSRQIEITAMRRDGHEFPVEVSLSSLFHDGTYSFNAFITDITQRKLAQIEQAHGQKMESIGQLSAGIAHEINTPMQYVGDNVHFLDSSFKDLLKALNEYDKLLQAGKQGAIPPELIESVETAAQQADLTYLVEEIPLAINQSQEGIGRVTKIVGAMKEFSHPGAEEKKLVDINRAIETTVTVARNEWKYVANVATDLAPDLPMVPALVNDIHQVILNLIVNAAHAIADVVGKNEDAKGTIKIRTRQNEGWVEIRVQDTGTGIPPEIRPKIFDPFFTTKAVGKGTGQGLSLCHAMITKRHNGSISFETEAGQGTTFIVRLPIPPKEPK